MGIIWAVVGGVLALSVVLLTLRLGRAGRGRQRRESLIQDHQLDPR